jgi:hypothetical protein
MGVEEERKRRKIMCSNGGNLFTLVEISKRFRKLRIWHVCL